MSGHSRCHCAPTSPMTLPLWVWYLSRFHTGTSHHSHAGRLSLYYMSPPALCLSTSVCCSFKPFLIFCLFLTLFLSQLHFSPQYLFCSVPSRSQWCSGAYCGPAVVLPAVKTWDFHSSEECVIFRMLEVNSNTSEKNISCFLNYENPFPKLLIPSVNFEHVRKMTHSLYESNSIWE